MKKSLTIFIMFLFTAGFVSESLAQPYVLSGRSEIGISMGMYSGSKSSNIVAISNFNTQVGANGFAGSLFYRNWLQENMALQFSVGMLTGSATVNVTNFNAITQSSAVMPLLLGINYYLLDLITNNSVRPYLSASAGMYFGTEASNSILSQQVHTESSFGGRIGAGVDFILSNHFVLGAGFGFNLMSDFSKPVGGNKNYNGGDFSIQLGYVF